MAGFGNFYGMGLARADIKSRIALPASLRNAIPEDAGGRIYVTKHESQPCLIGAGFDLTFRFKDYLDELAEGAREMGVPFNRHAASIRLQTGAALPIDGSGRFVLPDNLSILGQAKGELIMLGRGTVFEIWSIDVLMAGKGEAFEAAQEIARAALEARELEEKRKKGGAA